MNEPMRVAVTGGTGMIGGVLRDRLDARRFDLALLGHADADITDLAALERVFTGAAAVVHLAADSSVYAQWEDVVGPNLIGPYNVYEAARRAGVRRVVFASSNHAVGMYLHDDARFADPDQPEIVATDVPVRPDSLYGASKVWGEALGRFYVEQHGLEVVCLRIGWVTADDQAPVPERDVVRRDPEVSRRARGMWLSHRDCASLVDASLSADLAWGIVYGVSDNRGRWFSLDEGRDLLGWSPVDGLR